MHHGFTENINFYPWSSYETVTSDKQTKLKRGEVLELYGDKENFIHYHQQRQNLKEIDKFIIE